MRPFLTLHDPHRGREYYAAGLWTRDTFFTLLAAKAEQYPNKPALRDGTRTLTWSRLKAEVEAMAGDLAANGIIAGDRVSIWMSNKLEAIVTFLACSREGIA